MTDDRQAHRPVHRSDLAALVRASATGETADPSTRSELAVATAVAVLMHGRSGEGDLTDLADRVGLDTLAELWRAEAPSSLPGALWALYLLQRWTQSNGEEITQLWRTGKMFAPADEVVAGVSDDADPIAIGQLADAVLRGAYGGDFAVALERAAAFFRVVAEGRRHRADSGDDPQRERELADRNVVLAQGLTQAAARWRAQPL